MAVADELEPGQFWKIAGEFLEPQSFLRSNEGDTKAVCKDAGQIVCVLPQGYLRQQRRLRDLMVAEEGVAPTDVEVALPSWLNMNALARHREQQGRARLAVHTHLRHGADSVRHRLAWQRPLGPLEYARVQRMAFFKRRISGEPQSKELSGLFVRITLQQLIPVQEPDEAVRTPALQPTPLLCTLDYHLDAADEPFIIKRSYFHETKYLQPWSVNDQIRVFFHEDDGRLAATGNWYTGVITSVRDPNASRCSSWLVAYLSRAPSISIDDIHAWRSPWRSIRVMWSDEDEESQADPDREEDRWVHPWEVQIDMRDKIVPTRWDNARQAEDWDLDPLHAPAQIQGAAQTTSGRQQSGRRGAGRRRGKPRANAAAATSDQTASAGAAAAGGAATAASSEPAAIQAARIAPAAGQRIRHMPPRGYNHPACVAAAPAGPSSQPAPCADPPSTAQRLYHGLVQGSNEGTPDLDWQAEDMDTVASEQTWPVCGRHHFCYWCHQPAGDSAVFCSGPCGRCFHADCLRVNHDYPPDSEALAVRWQCTRCRHEAVRCCVCGEASRARKVIAQHKTIHKCSVPGCAWHYHLPCLQSLVAHLPVLQDNDIFVCPAHFCAQCKLPFVPGVDTDTRVCWRCPRAYHTRCMPQEARTIPGAATGLCECPTCFAAYRSARHLLSLRHQHTGTSTGALEDMDYVFIDEACRRGLRDLTWERHHSATSQANEPAAPAHASMPTPQEQGWQASHDLRTVARQLSALSHPTSDTKPNTTLSEQGATLSQPREATEPRAGDKRARDDDTIGCQGPSTTRRHVSTDADKAPTLSEPGQTAQVMADCVGEGDEGAIPLDQEDMGLYIQEPQAQCEGASDASPVSATTRHVDGTPAPQPDAAPAHASGVAPEQRVQAAPPAPGPRPAATPELPVVAPALAGHQSPAVKGAQGSFLRVIQSIAAEEAVRTATTQTATEAKAGANTASERAAAAPAGASSQAVPHTTGAGGQDGRNAGRAPTLLPQIAVPASFLPQVDVPPSTEIEQGLQGTAGPDTAPPQQQAAGLTSTQMLGVSGQGVGVGSQGSMGRPRRGPRPRPSPEAIQALTPSDFFSLFTMDGSEPVTASAPGSKPGGPCMGSQWPNEGTHMGPSVTTAVAGPEAQGSRPQGWSVASPHGGMQQGRVNGGWYPAMGVMGSSLVLSPSGKNTMQQGTAGSAATVNGAASGAHTAAADKHAAVAPSTAAGRPTAVAAATPSFTAGSQQAMGTTAAGPKAVSQLSPADRWRQAAKSVNNATVVASVDFVIALLGRHAQDTEVVLSHTQFVQLVTFAFVCQEALKAFYFALLQASKLLAPKVSTWSTPLVATKVRVELLVAAAAKRQPATPQEALIAQCSLALAREMADKLATATLQTTGRMVEDSQSVACQMLLSCVLGACESQGLVRTLERYTTQSSTPVGSPSKAAASGQVPTPHGSPSAAQQGSSSPAGEGAVPAAAPGTAPTAAAPATGVTAPAVTPAGAASEVAASPEAYAALLQVLGVAAAAAAAGLVASTSQAQLPANTSLSAGGVMGGSTMWPMPLMQGSLPIAPLPVSLPDLALKGSGRGRGGRDDMGSKPGSRESTPLHTPGVKPTIAKKPGTSTYKAGTAVHKWRKAAREAGNALGESAVDYVAFLIGSYGESTYKLHTQHQLPQVIALSFVCGEAARVFDAAMLEVTKDMPTDPTTWPLQEVSLKLRVALATAYASLDESTRATPWARHGDAFATEMAADLPNVSLALVLGQQQGSAAAAATAAPPGSGVQQPGSADAAQPGQQPGTDPSTEQVIACLSRHLLQRCVQSHCKQVGLVKVLEQYGGPRAVSTQGSKSASGAELPGTVSQDSAPLAAGLLPLPGPAGPSSAATMGTYTVPLVATVPVDKPSQPASAAAGATGAAAVAAVPATTVVGAATGAVTAPPAADPALQADPSQPLAAAAAVSEAAAAKATAGEASIPVLVPGAQLPVAAETSAALTAAITARPPPAAAAEATQVPTLQFPPPTTSVTQLQNVNKDIDAFLGRLDLPAVASPSKPAVPQGGPASQTGSAARAAAPAAPPTTSAAVAAVGGEVRTPAFAPPAGVAAPAKAAAPAGTAVGSANAAAPASKQTAAEAASPGARAVLPAAPDDAPVAAAAPKAATAGHDGQAQRQSAGTATGSRSAGPNAVSAADPPQGISMAPSSTLHHRPTPETAAPLTREAVEQQLAAAALWRAAAKRSGGDFAVKAVEYVLSLLGPHIDTTSSDLVQQKFHSVVSMYLVCQEALRVFEAAMLECTKDLSGDQSTWQLSALASQVGAAVTQAHAALPPNCRSFVVARWAAMLADNMATALVHVDPSRVLADARAIGLNVAVQRLSYDLLQRVVRSECRQIGLLSLLESFISTPIAARAPAGPSQPQRPAAAGAVPARSEAPAAPVATVAQASGGRDAALAASAKRPATAPADTASAQAQQPAAAAAARLSGVKRRADDAATGTAAAAAEAPAGPRAKGQATADLDAAAAASAKAVQQARASAIAALRASTTPPVSPPACQAAAAPVEGTSLLTGIADAVTAGTPHAAAAPGPAGTPAASTEPGQALATVTGADTTADAAVVAAVATDTAVAKPSVSGTEPSSPPAAMVTAPSPVAADSKSEGCEAGRSTTPAAMPETASAAEAHVATDPPLTAAAAAPPAQPAEPEAPTVPAADAATAAAEQPAAKAVAEANTEEVGAVTGAPAGSTDKPAAERTSTAKPPGTTSAAPSGKVGESQSTPAPASGTGGQSRVPDPRVAPAAEPAGQPATQPSGPAASRPTSPLPSLRSLSPTLRSPVTASIASAATAAVRALLKAVTPARLSTLPEPEPAKPETADSAVAVADGPPARVPLPAEQAEAPATQTAAAAGTSTATALTDERADKATAVVAAGAVAGKPDSAAAAPVPADTAGVTALPAATAGTLSTAETGPPADKAGAAEPAATAGTLDLAQTGAPADKADAAAPPAAAPQAEKAATAAARASSEPATVKVAGTVPADSATAAPSPEAGSTAGVAALPAEPAAAASSCHTARLAPVSAEEPAAAAASAAVPSKPSTLGAAGAAADEPELATVPAPASGKSSAATALAAAADTPAAAEPPAVAADRTGTDKAAAAPAATAGTIGKAKDAVVAVDELAAASDTRAGTGSRTKSAPASKQAAGNGEPAPPEEPAVLASSKSTSAKADKAADKQAVAPAAAAWDKQDAGKAPAATAGKTGAGKASAAAAEKPAVVSAPAAAASSKATKAKAAPAAVPADQPAAAAAPAVKAGSKTSTVKVSAATAPAAAAAATAAAPGAAAGRTSSTVEAAAAGADKPAAAAPAAPAAPASKRSAARAVAVPADKPAVATAQAAVDTDAPPAPAAAPAAAAAAAQKPPAAASGGSERRRSARASAAASSTAAASGIGSRASPKKATSPGRRKSSGTTQAHPPPHPGTSTAADPARNKPEPAIMRARDPNLGQVESPIKLEGEGDGSGSQAARATQGSQGSAGAGGKAQPAGAKSGRIEASGGQAAGAKAGPSETRATRSDSVRRDIMTIEIEDSSDEEGGAAQENRENRHSGVSSTLAARRAQSKAVQRTFTEDDTIVISDSD